MIEVLSEIIHDFYEYYVQPKVKSYRWQMRKYEGDKELTFKSFLGMMSIATVTMLIFILVWLSM